MGQYALIADIEQMFHQLKVREICQDALMFYGEQLNLKIQSIMLWPYSFLAKTIHPVSPITG